MMQSSNELPTNFERNKYDITLGYLEYPNRVGDKLAIPIQVRERHLTPGPTDATLQGIGPVLQIAFWTERDNILIRVPFVEWTTTPTYQGTLTGSNNGQLSVGRFEDVLEKVDGPDGHEKAISGEVIVHNLSQQE